MIDVGFELEIGNKTKMCEQKSQQKRSCTKNENILLQIAKNEAYLIIISQRMLFMDSSDIYLFGTEVLNPLFQSGYEMQYCFQKSENKLSSEPQISQNQSQDHSFDGEPKENVQSNSKTTGGEMSAEDFFSPSFIPKARRIRRNFEAYQSQKNKYGKIKKQKNIKKPKSTIAKVRTKNAYQNFRLPIKKFLNQSQKHSEGFDFFKREKTNNSIEIFEILLKEKEHANDFAFMFQHRCLKHAFMNGRSKKKEKVQNFERIRELKKRFLIIGQGLKI